MIKDFKKIILESLSKRNDVSLDDISLSKFYHGSRERHKVIFLAANKYRPVALLKLVRTPAENELLKHEFNIMNTVKSGAGFSVPEIYAHGEYNNLFYFVEEFVPGGVLTKQEAKKYINLILKFQLSQEKGNTLRLRDILGMLSQYKIQNEEFEDLLHFLIHMEYDTDLYRASGHGDLTYKNIIKVNEEGLCLIDWEKGDQRPIWGLDFCHYLARCGHNQQKNGFIHTINSLCDNTVFKSISKQDLVVICALDRMFDIMEKRFPQFYPDFIKKIKSQS